ncbi:hypothetical protein VW29_00305 [Devosia limi DSM 17137]|uniref:Dihydrofolate reductase n=1 Tax=Devosia limi DSM 17137 TaxID=1121477 RepID=A0A0F5LX38_9HYPH|nr:hypothetical protein [Devosia limi]KKB86739.1 hypothetical protein VW29_00305 [Devosia limi DSM 17137]SHF67103.1 Dihydrofolate reductase [Devosia limi DSM 17137]
MAGNEVVFYQAVSNDGFITDKSGASTWQGPYFIAELGFHEFIAGVASVILARPIYDRIVANGSWPYGDIPGIVATDQPLTDFAAPIIAAPDDPAALVAAAQEARPGLAWIVGDTALATRMILAGLVTRAELFVLPLALGSGTEYLAPDTLAHLDLVDQHTFTNGVVRLTYTRRAT